MTREERLVLAASRVGLDESSAGELRRGISQPLDWPAVLALAIPHGTLPLMARNFEAAVADCIPCPLLRQMKHYSGRIRTRNQAAARELVHLISALVGAGISAVPFKGPALEADLYRAEGLREFADMDVMVTRSQFPDAIEILRKLGYSGKADDRTEQARLRAGSPLEFAREGSITVDLHCRFSPRNFPFVLRPEDLEQERRPVQIAGQQIACYSPEATLLILCAHQARHRWRRLNWLSDISALSHTWPDMNWGEALRRGREAKCERLVLTTLALAEELLSVPMQSPVEHRLRDDWEARSLAASLAPGILPGLQFIGAAKSRWLFIRMQDGVRSIASVRYLFWKLRDLFS